MAIKSNKLGPGTLSIGATGSEEEWGAAVQSVRLNPSATEGDTITVLTGDEMTDDGEETWTLEGNVLQSYDADSLILWANLHSGEEMPFEFIPRNESALRASGTVLVRSLSVGGDVKTRNTSDFNFRATNVALSAGSGV